MSILEVRNLSFYYEKDKQILKNIYMKIERGSFIALLGANGCGKTTLVQQLNGLLKPTGGEVLLKGTNLEKLSDKQIFSKIGLVFQNPDDQLFAFTVYEDVAYGAINLGIKGDELKDRVESALRLLNIYDLKDREIHKLSFGQKKRVAIAGILAMKPEILVLDEPTAGLDPMTTSNLMKTLKNIQKDEGVTIIISTHEVDIVPVNCDYVYVLNKGQVAVQGTPLQVFKSKSVLRESNLRLPRIGHLMEILKEKDKIDIDSSAMTISGARRVIMALLGKKSDKEYR
ncbi:MAG: ATP-binding cassette domain-containing protein [Clostridia bacterium]|nr:ATP-binding cassette domain-containing protein [Clostridia bacterium]